MTQNQFPNIRALQINPRFEYLPEKDRYLTKPTTPKYRFALIGGGIIGQEHIRVTALEGRGIVTGLYDPNPGSVDASIQESAIYAPEVDLKIYGSLHEACHDPEIDGILICTPNYTHLEIVLEAIKSGKHILLEKPIATTVEDAYEIMQIAEAYEGVFQVGLQYRYKSIMAETIYETFERGTIGDVKTISILEHRIPFLDKVNQWNKFSKFSGDTLVEKCCHYFDIFNLLAQSRPLNVYASGSQAVNFTEFEYNGEKSDILDNALAIVNYENGIRANFNLSMFAPLFHEELIVCGDEGRIRAGEVEDFMHDSQPRSYMDIMCGDKRPSRKTNPMYNHLIESTGHGGATFYEHVHFINNIEGIETITATAREGLWAVIVAAAAQESIKCGCVVDINEFLSKKGIDI